MLPNDYVRPFTIHSYSNNKIFSLPKTKWNATLSLTIWHGLRREFAHQSLVHLYAVNVPGLDTDRQTDDRAIAKDNLQVQQVQV